MAIDLKFDDVVVEFPKITVGGKNDRHKKRQKELVLKALGERLDIEIQELARKRGLQVKS